jgi:hypothetical protein
MTFFSLFEKRKIGEELFDLILYCRSMRRMVDGESHLAALGSNRGDHWVTALIGRVL